MKEEQRENWGTQPREQKAPGISYCSLKELRRNRGANFLTVHVGTGQGRMVLN